MVEPYVSQHRKKWPQTIERKKKKQITEEPAKKLLESLPRKNQTLLEDAIRWKRKWASWLRERAAMRFAITSGRGSTRRRSETGDWVRQVSRAAPVTCPLEASVDWPNSALRSAIHGEFHIHHGFFWNIRMQIIFIAFYYLESEIELLIMQKVFYALICAVESFSW